MELQGISNRASQQVLQVEGSASLASASATCSCADPACNCSSGQLAAQNLLTSRVNEVQLSEQGRQLSLQADTDSVISSGGVDGVAGSLSVKPSAGLLQLDLRQDAAQANAVATVPPKVQQALRAYQNQQAFG